jgi:iron complex transport system ATP-binding protein
VDVVSTLRFRSPTISRGAFTLTTGEVSPAAGRVTVLIGPNGGGKTTAIRAAAGMLVPAHGAILLDGAPIHSMPAAQRAARMALVAQRPEVGAPFSVREVVALGRALRPHAPERIERALARTGLAALAERPFHALSGGQQQRAAVARALAQHEPEGVLLLDEAFAAVDPPEAAALVREIRAEAAAGATVLAATHDLSVASALADDVWCIAGGRTVAFGASCELLTHRALPSLLGVAVVEANGARGTIAVADYGAILPNGIR